VFAQKLVKVGEDFQVEGHAPLGLSIAASGLEAFLQFVGL
jgi:hypothetical protein